MKLLKRILYWPYHLFTMDIKWRNPVDFTVAVLAGMLAIVLLDMWITAPRPSFEDFRAQVETGQDVYFAAVECVGREMIPQFASYGYCLRSVSRNGRLGGLYFVFGRCEK